MHREDFEGEATGFASTPGALPPRTQLNDIDAALNELGMLSTLTESRREYLRECNRNVKVNVLEMNTRYVRSFSFGLRMKPVTAHARPKPYTIPVRREERHRTRSENADGASDQIAPAASVAASVVDTIVDLASSSDDSGGAAAALTSASMKKSKSLENVHLEQRSVPEMELVSTCIEKLKMTE